MKKISMALTGGAMLVGIVALIVYGCTGVTVFSSQLSPGMFATGVIGLVIGAFSIVMIVTGLWPEVMARFLKLIIFICFLMWLMALLFYIASQVNYLASIFVGIDGTKFTAEFIIIVLFLLIAAGCTLAASIVCRPCAKEAANER